MKRNPSTLPACLAGGLVAGLLFGAAMCLILYALGELFTWKLIPFIAAVSIGDSLFLGYALHVFLQKYTDAGIQLRRLKDLWADKAFRRLVAAPCLLVLLVVGLTCAAGVLRRAYSTPLVFIPLSFILILTTSHYKPADPQPCRITFGKPRPLPALLKGTGGAAPAYPWGQRVLSTPAHYAYLRIADGCDNRCAYCAIPGIRGNYASRPVEELAEEAEALAERGVKELYVIAQDTTRYGFDRYGKAMLPELLQRLNAIPGLVWIRLLYAYPDTLTPQVLDTMAECEKVVKYIDLPLQHADDGVLRSMNRRGNAAHYAALIDELRRRDPAYVLRTTYMVGFPTETEERFEALCRFAQEHPFDRVGVFTYSPEEGTPAEPLGDPVPQEEKERRAAKLMRLQQKISLAFHQARVGKTYDVLVDGADERSGLLIGRTYGEAAEIDGVVAFVPNTQHAPGDLARVKITEAREYDLFGEETKR